MIKFTDTFVFAKREITTDDGDAIQKDAVGIIVEELPECATIYFVKIGQTIIVNSNDFEIFNVDETGDQHTKKICNICHRLLDTHKFARNQNGVNNRPVRRPSCDSCRVELDGKAPSAYLEKQWRSEKPHKVPFECPICKKRTIAGVTSKLDLDHNHRTGAIRGWVCDSCNTGIGRFKDDIELIKSAMKFLEQ